MIPKLHIETTPAKIGLSINEAKQTIRQPLAEQSIQQPEAELRVEQRPGKLTIDQTKAWDNIDLKSVFKRTEAMVRDAEQGWMEGISRVAREGDELMKIENGGNPIAAHAEQNSKYSFTLQPGGLPAYDLVDIRYQPSEAEVSVKRNDPIIETTPVNPSISYQPGEVTLKNEQYADVQIDWKV
ncbi:DUF6470 family protein [Halobacillus litoralis]|uniref:DUF6470 family protein n=1 Tax=Halobacillus litoralis TaxID=45668 RepID=UPI001CFE72CE|nr:DUF6470 family protein [Halobacillus litoralis]